MCPLVGERCRRLIVVRPMMPSEGVMQTGIAVDCRVRFGGKCRFDLSNAPNEINVFSAPVEQRVDDAVHQILISPKPKCYIYCNNMSRINNQFSVGVHIMTALGDHHGEQVTSAHLTASVRAHESQVRSVLSKLVKAGLVVTSRGRHGFSSLARPANKISLLEIYKAIDAPPVFSIHEYPKEKTCRTSCTHKEAMTELLEDTQRAFETRLGQRMLSEIVARARSYR